MGDQAMWDIAREADDLRGRLDELSTQYGNYVRAAETEAAGLREDSARYKQALERIEAGERYAHLIAHQALHPKEGETFAVSRKRDSAEVIADDMSDWPDDTQGP